MKLPTELRTRLEELVAEQELSGASAAYLQALPTTLRIPLPESYLEFLAICNDAEIEGIRFCGDEDSEFELISNAREMREFIPEIRRKKVYPFACTWGGDWLCFDLREKSADAEYAIILWQHEEAEAAEEDEVDNDEVWEDIAPDFPTYLQELLAPEEE